MSYEDDFDYAGLYAKLAAETDPAKLLELLRTASDRRVSRLTEGDDEGFEVLDVVFDGRVKDKPDVYEVVVRHVPTGLLFAIDGYYSSWEAPSMDGTWELCVKAEKTVSYYKRMKAS